MNARLGIIAGGGGLPRQLIESCRALGREVFVVALNGQAEPSAVVEVPHEWCDIGAVGRAMQALKEAGCDEVCFAGAVERPNFAELKPDWQGLKLLPKVVAAARAGGDDAILTAVLAHVEAEGFTVVAPETVLGGLAPPLGPLGRHRPSVADRADIAKGLEVIRALGPHDVGQATVVKTGQVLAIEAAEGTDAMLARCVAWRGERLGGVLVKGPKPGQERRVDLPTIGPATVEAAAQAGLAGIAVVARGALVVERDRTVRLADAAGLFVLGVGPEAEC